jgi:hypothetical protein
MEIKLIESVPLKELQVVMLGWDVTIFFVKYKEELDLKGYCTYPGHRHCIIYVSGSVDWELTLAHELFHFYEWITLGVFDVSVDREQRTHTASSFSLWYERFVTNNRPFLLELEEYFQNLNVLKWTNNYQVSNKYPD